MPFSMQRKRSKGIEKKKAGGQNKGIVEEEAPFGLDALIWKRNGIVAIEDGDGGYDWGFPAEAWLPAVRKLTRSPRQSDGGGREVRGNTDGGGHPLRITRI